ncbi:MAG TPA: beta-galactosidase [Candidatus Saccharimonadales bacterium]|nr:beta-galactosidase [Candidatus Saccharimonadales bacterium]
MSFNNIKNKLKTTLIMVLPKRRWLRRIAIVLIAFVVVGVSGMYGIAQWYIHTSADKPLEMGVSFIPDYARSLGVDPEETMDALTGIGVKQFRLVSYWSNMERTKGEYDFSQLDWQFRKAEAADAKVMLVVGLRQPRWPECHMPDWAKQEPASQWTPQLKKFMSAVVERYKDSPSLQQYQLENEYFLKGFGICTDFSRQRLIDEYDLVKRLDPAHPIVVGRSNNSLGFPIGQPQPDEFSISVYKRVWDAGVSRRYLEYPQPAWFYGYLAGVQKIFLGKDMVIGELQAEAWPPNGKPIPQTSLAEQNKSFNAERFKDRIAYGKATGMRQIDLWGAEYWYYRSTVLKDPSLWNVAKEEFSPNRD